MKYPAYLNATLRRKVRRETRAIAWIQPVKHADNLYAAMVLELETIMLTKEMLDNQGGKTATEASILQDHAGARLRRLAGAAR